MSEVESGAVHGTIDKRTDDPAEVSESDGHSQDHATFKFTAGVVSGPCDGDCDGGEDAAGSDDRSRVACAGLSVRVCGVEDCVADDCEGGECEYEGTAEFAFVRVDADEDGEDTGDDVGWYAASCVSTSGIGDGRMRCT
jgi:hypothetical protein